MGVKMVLSHGETRTEKNSKREEGQDEIINGGNHHYNASFDELLDQDLVELPLSKQE